MAIRNIIKGWGKYFGILPVLPAEQALSDLRMSMCAACPAAKTSKALRLINGQQREVSGLYCSRCKCPCLQKTIVVSEKCPLKLW